MDRRTFLATGGVSGIGMLAGCFGAEVLGDGGDSEDTDGNSGDGATPSETDTASSDESTPSSDGGDGTTTGGNTETITIGALEPLSGNFLPWGQSHRLGLEFAISEVNSRGGIDGAELDLVVQDTESDPKKANTAFQRFVEQEDVVAVTGPVSSNVGIQTSERAEQLEIPMLLHMAGSAKVLDRSKRYTFRVGLLPAPTIMRGQAQIVADNGYEQVGAITADYSWGQSVKSSIQETFPVDVAIQEAGLGTDDFRPTLRELPPNLEMLVVTGHPPGTVPISSQAAELDIEPALSTGPGIPPQVIWGALGETARAVNLTHIHLTDVESEAYQEVASNLADHNGARMDTNEGYGYVTGKLLAAAIRNAGSTSPPDIADALRNISFETIYAEPIEYTEWGELRNQRILYSQFEPKAPNYYPGGGWRLSEFFRSDPLEPYVPGE